MQAWISVRVVLKKFSEDCVISSLLPCQNLQYHMAETSLSSTLDTISIDKLSRYMAIDIIAAQFIETL
jgi:hypothetical protein